MTLAFPPSDQRKSPEPLAWGFNALRGVISWTSSSLPNWSFSYPNSCSNSWMSRFAWPKTTQVSSSVFWPSPWRPSSRFSLHPSQRVSHSRSTIWTALFSWMSHHDSGDRRFSCPDGTRRDQTLRHGPTQTAQTPASGRCQTPAWRQWQGSQVSASIITSGLGSISQTGYVPPLEISAGKCDLSVPAHEFYVKIREVSA